jgi:RimJ/RimL family protein N-acetyltransferase
MKNSPCPFSLAVTDTDHAGMERERTAVRNYGATMLRLATGDDSGELVQLIDSVLREYGDRIHLEGADSDLLDLPANYFASGGAFWVLELDGRICGSHATRPSPDSPEVCNLKRLYLAPHLRGTHWGSELMQVTIDWAEHHGFRRIEFWSDTRFERAHRFFERFGFRKDGRVRDMDDGFMPYAEYFFFLELSGDRRALNSSPAR